MFCVVKGVYIDKLVRICTYYTSRFSCAVTSLKLPIRNIFKQFLKHQESALEKRYKWK